MPGVLVIWSLVRASAVFPWVNILLFTALKEQMCASSEWCMEGVHLGRYSSFDSFLFDIRLHFMQPAGRFQEFSGAAAVGGTNQTVGFHDVDQMGGATVAHAQAALQQ